MDEHVFSVLLQMKSAVQSFTILRCYVKKYYYRSWINNHISFGLEKQKNI